MSRKKIVIGLFGFGCVGKGLWDILQQRTGLVDFEIRKICVNDRNKAREFPSELLTFEADDILGDPDINLVVELIDNADAAFSIITRAFKNGKSVVSANKKMIAENFRSLLELQRKHAVSFLYEAACCASIPIIRNLEEYYDNDMLELLEGIVNGSTNFILTRMNQQGLEYEDALNEAKELGYAESNPKLDVEGFDSKYKLTILMAHAFGITTKPETVFNLGINRLGKGVCRYAREKGYKIKLIARAMKLRGDEYIAYVMPQFIKPDNNLFHVDGVYNGVITETFFSDRQFFVGRGAGAFPTASAVLSDISAISYDYKYEYKKLVMPEPHLTDSFFLDVLVVCGSEYCLNPADFSDVAEEYHAKDYHFISGAINFRKLTGSSWIGRTDVSVVLLPLARGKA
ncbi:MAG: homoserine dehydrogenase [Bacteroidales bacterium]|jgi:homoserine dehydrogenase